jgi:hypothetical protein
MRKSILISGSLAQRPGHGGHAWVFLQYLLGFKRLGWDVLFLDWLDTAMCLDEGGSSCALEQSWNYQYFMRVMDEFEIDFSLDYNHGQRTIGLSRADVITRAKSAVFLLNFMGFLSDAEVLDAVSKRVFLDIDPGFGQMWQEQGLATIFSGHDEYVTIGENVGQADCGVPTCGLKWIATPQPVVLERWPAGTNNLDGPFTSIISWRGPFGPIEYKGHTYGLRVHEFRKFVSLPRIRGHAFELALDIHPTEWRDLEMLDENGWQLKDPRKVAGDPWSYQQYITESKAEFMVAKGLYVDTHGGWFSDRSICYLASGKPVLAQDTGFTKFHPTGEGLLAFSTLDEACTGVDEILGNYEHHSRAARAIAEDCFDSDKVLARLIDKLNVG